MQIRRWDAAIEARKRMIELRTDKLREEIRLADMAYSERGSTKEGDDLLTRLTPAQRESPRVLEFRKQSARIKGDYAEFKRLDALLPFFEEDGQEHWFYLIYNDIAVTYAAHGDIEAARKRLENFPAELRSRLEREPANLKLYTCLSKMDALLGHREEAQRLARKAMELMPESLDALDGPLYRFVAAQIDAWLGNKEAALATLEHVVRVPGYFTVHDLQTNPWFTSLHSDPRFEALLNDP